MVFFVNGKRHPCTFYPRYITKHLFEIDHDT